MRWMKQLLVSLTTSLLLAGGAHADMVVEVVGVGSQQYPIAIAPFQNEAGLKQPVTPVISNDLTLSGLFKVIGAGDVSPVPFSPAEINAAALLQRGAQTMLVGRTEMQGNELVIRFWLIDLASKKELISFEKRGSPALARRMAHQIADMIYEKITGKKGAFASRIAYVLKTAPNRYELQVADADGYGAQSVLSSKLPIMSPKWSPDGGRLAYVSFETQKPAVYVHELATGKRWAAANFKGSNSAPAWSPDGRQLAVVLTKDGGSHVYLVDLDGSNLRRLTTTGDINTEPAFGPDGRIYFTSDRGGSPQIYRMNRDGSGVERVTFGGAYNAGAKFSPDGKTMTYISREGGYRVAIMELATRQSMTLTDSGLDDSPTFAPNGQMILYETGARGSLAVVSVDGRVKQRLKAQNGDVRQPAWGPMLP
ncbi:Tol-Pal system beta propeller repeat protein TolB [Chitinilyticum piscinae]|uniref:Tol-Pal system protein TolB n=1 Tax=Chitinilyticum piscinae TaxID=2866724 RepID=A0A8J7KCX2_9NEIS|nr:Tol-Pal system beta propeller repeat protein TolB [Chitinilyticum piscinae]MBE9608184.1 Tol-Pal system protein TolB [Chitinilyticum piscinae]